MDDKFDEILRELFKIRDRLSRIEEVLEQPQKSTVQFSFTGIDSVERAQECADTVVKQIGSDFDRAAQRGVFGRN